MKMIKQTMALLLAMMTVIFASCEPVEPPVTEDPTLSLSTETLSFIYSGETKTVLVTTNQEEYTATVSNGDESWAIVSTDGNTISIEVLENTKEEVRPTTLTVKAGGVTKRVRVSQEAAPPAPKNPRTFTIPAFDEETMIYKLMHEGVQFGVVCKEYLRGTGIDAQAIVVYPMANDKIDFSKGFVAQVIANDEAGIPTGHAVAQDVHAGRVAFEAESNAIASYTAGTKPAVTIISMDEDGNIAAAAEMTYDVLAVEKDLCIDIDENNYGVVKVGKQIWMRQNLRVTKQKNGSAISGLDGANEEKWQSAPCYIKACVDSPVYGLLYNAIACGYAGGSLNDQIAPEGYFLPNNEQWSSLAAYVGGPDAGGKLKTIGNDDWDPFDQDITGTNITEFSAVGAGYGNSDGSLAPDGSKCHVFYISTTAYDGGLGRFNINRSQGSFLLQAEGGCLIGYGVRCLRY